MGKKTQKSLPLRRRQKNLSHCHFSLSDSHTVLSRSLQVQKEPFNFLKKLKLRAILCPESDANGALSPAQYWRSVPRPPSFLLFLSPPPFPHQSLSSSLSFLAPKQPSKPQKGFPPFLFPTFIPPSAVSDSSNGCPHPSLLSRGGRPISVINLFSSPRSFFCFWCPRFTACRGKKKKMSADFF